MFNVIFAVVLIGIPLLALAIYLTVLVVRALRKYIKNAPVRKETKTVRTTLAQKLRENRIRCKMSQEFVAEAVGVTRQAVSKWEPSTANLIALAKLYKISTEELLDGL